MVASSELPVTSTLYSTIAMWKWFCWQLGIKFFVLMPGLSFMNNSWWS